MAGTFVLVCLLPTCSSEAVDTRPANMLSLTSLLGIQMEMTPKWPCSPDKAFNVGSERNFPDFDSGVMNVMVGSPGGSQECNMTVYDVT